KAHFAVNRVIDRYVKVIRGHQRANDGVNRSEERLKVLGRMGGLRDPINRAVNSFRATLLRPIAHDRLTPSVGKPLGADIDLYNAVVLPQQAALGPHYLTFGESGEPERIALSVLEWQHLFDVDRQQFIASVAKHTGKRGVDFNRFSGPVKDHDAFGG